MELKLTGLDTHRQKVSAWVKFGKESSLTHCHVRVKDPAEDEVLVDFACSGVCHSDLAMSRDDWGMTTYPTILGHEGVGVIVKLGTAVTTMTIGQRVGLGWNCSSCMSCNFCKFGDQHLCSESRQTIVGSHALGGTFSKRQSVKASSLVLIPEGIPDPVAAPLLCSGITAFQPLRRWVRPGMTVGIITLGAIGHYAIQFAKAMGCHVIVFSTSRSKCSVAELLGANEFCIIESADKTGAALESHEPSVMNRCDFILNTCPYKIDLNSYMRALTPNGVMCYLGIPGDLKTLKIPFMPMLMGQRTITTSGTGGQCDFVHMFKIFKSMRLKSRIRCRDISNINDILMDVSTGKLPHGVLKYVIIHGGNADQWQTQVDGWNNCQFKSFNKPEEERLTVFKYESPSANINSNTSIELKPQTFSNKDKDA